MEKKVLAALWNVVDRIDNSRYVSSIVLNQSSLAIEYKNGFKQTYELPFPKQEVIESINKDEILEELKEEVKKLLPNDVSALYQAEINKFKADVETKIKSINTLVNGKDGQDGKDIDEQKIIESLQTAITKKLEYEVENIKQSIPQPINGVDGKDADEEKIVENLTSVLIGKLESELLIIKQSIPELIIPKDGKDAYEEAIKASLLEVINVELKAGLEKIVAEIPLAKDGVNGRNVDEEAITNALETKLADKIANVKQELLSQITEIIKQSVPDIKDGADGKDADQEAILAALTELLNKRIKEQETSIKEALQDELGKIIASIPTPKDGLNGIDGQDGKNADEDKIISALQDGLDYLVSSAIDKLQQDLRLFATETIDKIKSSFKPIKGDKGDTGDKGERGNGIKNAQIDRRDHLIITTDDQVIDAGQIKGKQIFYGGGTGSFKYTNTMPLPFDVGGYKQGTRFNEVEQRVLWTKLLYGLDLPNFGQFSIESIPQNVEVGYQIAAGDYTTNFTINNPELLEEDSITITGNGTEILSNLPNSSPIVLPLPEYKLDALGVVNFQIYAYDTTGVSFLKDYACSYKYKIYYGEYTEDIEDTGLPNPMSILRAQELVTDIKGEYLFLDIGYKWFCYPESLGENYVFYEITSDIAIVFDEVKKISITNNYGVALTYNCFRTLHEINQEFVMGIK